MVWQYLRARDVVVGVFGIPYLHAFVQEGGKERERGEREGTCSPAGKTRKLSWKESVAWSGKAAGMAGCFGRRVGA